MRICMAPAYGREQKVLKIVGISQVLNLTSVVLRTLLFHAVMKLEALAFHLVSYSPLARITETTYLC